MIRKPQPQAGRIFLKCRWGHPTELSDNSTLFAAQTRRLKPKNRLKPIAQAEVQLLSHFGTDIYLAQTVLEEKRDIEEKH